MPVYSKIQQIRDAKRRERQPKWKQRKQKESRELSQSLSAVQKRKQRENTTKFIKADAERKANARERKRRTNFSTYHQVMVVELFFLRPSRILSVKAILSPFAFRYIFDARVLRPFQIK
jgi:hypothetical protein